MAPEDRSKASEAMYKSCDGFERIEAEDGSPYIVNIGDAPGVFQDLCSNVGLYGTVRAKDIFGRFGDLIEPFCTVESRPASGYKLSCGHWLDWYEREPPKYCPYCGAFIVYEREKS